MATTHYHCEVCGCLDLEEKFSKEDESHECPDCHEPEDVFPYRMFRCGIEDHEPEPEQLTLFESDLPVASEPVLRIKGGCGRVAEQLEFFGDGLPADLDPKEEMFEYECPYCEGTVYEQIPVTEIKRGDPAIIEREEQKKTA